MKIKNKLYFSDLITLLLVTLLFFVSVFFSADLNKKTEEHMRFMDIKTDILDLNTAVYEYIILHNKERKDNWDAKYRSAFVFLEKEYKNNKELESIFNKYREVGDSFNFIIEKHEEGYGSHEEQNDHGAVIGKSDFDVLLKDIGSLASDITRLSNKSFSEIISIERQIRNLTIILILILGIFVSIFLFWISRGITRSLAILEDGTKRIGRGDTDFRISIKSKDEIKDLAEEFNRMAANIQNINANLQNKSYNLEYERLRAEEEKKKFEIILRSIGDAVVACNDEGKIIMFNDVSEKLFGISAKDAIGARYSDKINIIDEETKESCADHIKRSITEKNISKITRGISVKRNNGKEIPVAQTAAPIKNGKGKIIGCVAVFRDITIEQEVDRMKSEFVSVASHQLRTPMTTIKLFIEMLIKGEVGDLNKKQKEYIKRVQESTERMIGLLNDLLEVSRLKSGAFNINYEKVKMDNLVKEAIKEVKLLSNAEKCLISFEKPEGKVPDAYTDSHLMHQIIKNILDNSVQYSKEGTCDVSVELSFNKRSMTISVEDNGIGIPKEAQTRIFERFFRADNAVKTSATGTGLGLHVVKSTLDMLGGKVWFESEEGKGSKFYIKFPLKPKGFKL